MTRMYPSPFPAEHRQIMVVPSIGTRYSQRNGYIPHLAGAMAGCVRARPGNYIAFFPSFEYLETARDEIIAYIDQSSCPEGITTDTQPLNTVEVICQERAMTPLERARVLNDLRHASNGRSTLILAVQGGIFSEGVDYPGEALSGVIIIGPGLPSPSFERALVHAYFQERYGKGFEYAYLYPGLARVIQAAGRLIRSQDDKGIILLVGERFARKRYTAHLPPDWFKNNTHLVLARSGADRREREPDLLAKQVHEQVRRFWNPEDGSVFRMTRPEHNH